MNFPSRRWRRIDAQRVEQNVLESNLVEGKRVIAKRLLPLHDVNAIAEIVDLPLAEVEKIKKGLI